MPLAGARRRGARRELGWRTLLVACVVGSFATMVGAVAIQGERIKLQERADAIATRTAAAQERQRALRVEVATAESPEHVLDAARELGMVEPGPIAAVPAAEPTTTVPPTTTPSSSPQAPTTAGATAKGASTLPAPAPGDAG